jgi:hypothetical protein
LSKGVKPWNVLANCFRHGLLKSSKHIDVLLQEWLIADGYTMRMLEAANATLPGDASRIPAPHKLHCDNQQITDLVQSLGSHRWMSWYRTF